ncbi:MAG: carboxypeptidase regulatory-like domain-containing protein, partial [Acidobacteriaceae bacterium]
MLRIFHRLFWVWVVIGATAGTLLAQAGATGTILGTISDKTGAVVPNAQVTIVNTATNVSRQVQTSSAGDFSVPDLQPGPYTVTVVASGFTKAVVGNITLQVAQQARVNATLTQGAATETIQVNASAVALDTDTASVSQIVTQKQVDQLPLNGRNFLNLLFIGAGAVQTVGEQGQMRQGEGNAISINGARPESNNYTLDGMVNTDTALNTPAVILSQDAIQEFRVQSETYSAEYGFSANQINIISKSGTNRFHGSVFEFARNDAFDASTHFQPSKPELRQNQFGYVLGGPVWIPKIYDGHNKTFFLANYEGWRIRNGTSSYYTLPSQAELGGDFSTLGLPAYGSAACTTALTAGSPCQPIDPVTGAPFPG